MAYDQSDPKHPDYHSTHADIWDNRDKSGPVVIDTPDGIEAYRLLAIKGRLRLELTGLRFRINTFAHVKREFGFKGSKQKVYDQYIAMLKERGILKEDT